MATDQEKKNTVDDILKDVENKPAEQTSRITRIFNVLSAVGEVALKAKDMAVGAAEFAYRAYQIPAVKGTILSPYAKARTPSEQAVAYGVLALGIGAGVATYGWGFTIYGSKLLGSAVACKGTQFGIQFASRLFNGKATDKPLLGEDNTPVKTSQADVEMGEDDKPTKPTINTQKKSDLDIF